MRFEPVKLLNVFYVPADQKIFVGRLALKSRQIYFEYDVNFLKNGVNLSPFKLPFKSGAVKSSDSIFDGLFGVFNDSLPDGWGCLLLDRALMKNGVNPRNLSALDRLSFVGSKGLGALIYEPENEGNSVSKSVFLDDIAAEIKEFQENENEEYVENLLQLNGSSAGARPKILLNLENQNWIIKFPSGSDFKDIGAIEYAYYLMAKEAGLNVANSKLFPSKNGYGFFGSERFDLNEKGRIHMHSVSGLLHVDHRTPSLDYEMILKAIMHLTNDFKECEKQFRQCVFNVLTHNRDDHSKNFSFLMDAKGVWKVSPAYDLTFSSGPSGEHCSMIMGEGKNPGMQELMKLAESSNISKNAAETIIAEVMQVVENWPKFAEIAGVSKKSFKLIDSELKKVRNQFC